MIDGFREPEQCVNRRIVGAVSQPFICLIMWSNEASNLICCVLPTKHVLNREPTSITRERHGCVFIIVQYLQLRMAKPRVMAAR